MNKIKTRARKTIERAALLLATAGISASAFAATAHVIAYSTSSTNQHYAQTKATHWVDMVCDSFHGKKGGYVVYNSKIGNLYLVKVNLTCYY